MFGMCLQASIGWSQLYRSWQCVKKQSRISWLGSIRLWKAILSQAISGSYAEDDSMMVMSTAQYTVCKNIVCRLALEFMIWTDVAKALQLICPACEIMTTFVWPSTWSSSIYLTSLSWECAFSSLSFYRRQAGNKQSWKGLEKENNQKLFWWPSQQTFRRKSILVHPLAGLAIRVESKQKGLTESNTRALVPTSS